jgi:trehalose/maltose transport system substrate-binding protein
VAGSVHDHSSVRRPVAHFGFERLHSAKEPVTLTFLDPEWSHDSRERRSISEDVLQEFTRTTGIRVTHLPAPENSPAQLALEVDLLKKAAPTPDVYGIDVIWPRILNEYLVDLRPHFGAELASQDRELVANYTVKDKLVEVPYHADIGILHYRRDLLEKYGYREPPQPGMNSRKRPHGFRKESARKAPRIFGASCGQERPAKG